VSEAESRLGRVAIVGLGLMGGSLAMALRRARPEVEVVGIDSDPATVEKAVSRGVAAVASGDLEVVAGSGLIVLAVPIGRMASVIDAIGPLAGGAVITDLASTKVRVQELAATAGLNLVGGHPMCGSERSGIDAADPDLFVGAAWLLTRSDAAVEELVRASGAHALIVDAQVHDRLVAGVSHAAFLVSVGYVLALAASPDWNRMAGLAASGYRDVSRLAGGDPDLYMGIVDSNRANVEEALDSVIASLTRIRRHLDAQDPRLVELFEEARAVRERWQRERDAGGG
jgi:prephenate dehydrogenase